MFRVTSGMLKDTMLYNLQTAHRKMDRVQNQVATGKKGVLSRKGVLRDINQNGMGFKMSAHGLKKNESIRIGVMLGRRGFKTNAVVRWTSNDRVGVEYINPRPDDYSFLAELYGAKKLGRI